MPHEDNQWQEFDGLGNDSNNNYNNNAMDDDTISTTSRRSRRYHARPFPSSGSGSAGTPFASGQSGLFPIGSSPSIRSMKKQQPRESQRSIVSTASSFFEPRVKRVPSLNSRMSSQGSPKLQKSPVRHHHSRERHSQTQSHTKARTDKFDFPRYGEFDPGNYNHYKSNNNRATAMMSQQPRPPMSYEWNDAYPMYNRVIDAIPQAHQTHALPIPPTQSPARQTTHRARTTTNPEANDDDTDESNDQTLFQCYGLAKDKIKLPKSWSRWVYRVMIAIACSLILTVVFLACQPDFLMHNPESDVLVSSLSVPKTAFAVLFAACFVIFADCLDGFLRKELNR